MDTHRVAHGVPARAARAEDLRDAYLTAKVVGPRRRLDAAHVAIATSSLAVLPAIPDADGPDDQLLPEVADWELLSPFGLLNAGPGLKWSFEPKGNCPGDTQPSG
jgi:hypothetical protein